LGQSKPKPSQSPHSWLGLWILEAKATLSQAKAIGFRAKPSQNITNIADVLGNCFTELQNFCSAAWYQIGVRNERETSAEGKNHRKSSQMSRNDRN
jgi:hypothetical protein